MCGRIVCRREEHVIRHHCKYKNSKGAVKAPAWRDVSGEQKYNPSYNISPGTHTPVLLQCRSGSDERVLQPMLWGLVPSWHKGSLKDFGYKMNNCRSETMLQMASFKMPLRRGQRCVVVADGFYEWKTENGVKQPYYIYLSDDEERTKLSIHSTGECNFEDDADTELMKMAGVYDKWTSPNGDVTYSFSVITVSSSSSVGTIHHRMPAILKTEEDVDTWINCDVPINKAVSVIHPSNQLSFHPVSTAVNNSRHNHAQCIVQAKLKPCQPSKSASFMKNWFQKVDATKSEPQAADVRKSECPKDEFRETAGDGSKLKVELKRPYAYDTLESPVPSKAIKLEPGVMNQ